MQSLHPPFMNRLCPAETRLKEGAKRTRLRPNRWECSLAAGWWRPVSALAGVSRDFDFDVKRAFLFQLPNPLLQELPLWFLLGQRQSFLIRGPGRRCPAKPAVHVCAG